MCDDAPPLPDGILVTRPEPGGAETAARVAALGWRPVLAPALVLQPRAFAAPRAQAVLLTSRAAARALPAGLAALPVLAVGAATAAEARARGFTDARAAEGTAETLAALAGATLDPGAGPLLLAVGKGYALDLADALRARGFRVVRRIAYAAAPATFLPEEALAGIADRHVGRVLLHSPRSAHCAIRLLRAAGLGPRLAGMEMLAISPRVAEAARAALAPIAWRATRVAARPGEDELLALLGRPGRAA